MRSALALLSEELKDWIGREESYPAREEMGRASIRYFALAIDDDNPLYQDDDYAHEAGYPSLIAPRLDRNIMHPSWTETWRSD